MVAAESRGDRIDRVMGSPEAVTRALARGVREALRRHREAKLPVAVWHDEKVTWTVLEPEGQAMDGAALVRDGDGEEAE